jgi:predicted RNase H-like nuclease (RuvC/YqgF family)
MSERSQYRAHVPFGDGRSERIAELEAEVERLRESETELCAQIVRLQDEAEDVHAEAERLREALNAELTHGGIADRTAQVAAILGCGDEHEKAMGARLDADRNAFRDRIQTALDPEHWP